MALGVGVGVGAGEGGGGLGTAAATGAGVAGGEVGVGVPMHAQQLGTPAGHVTPGVVAATTRLKVWPAKQLLPGAGWPASPLGVPIGQMVMQPEPPFPVSPVPVSPFPTLQAAPGCLVKRLRLGNQAKSGFDMGNTSWSRCKIIMKSRACKWWTGLHSSKQQSP